jgi:hypothetical protein
VKESRRSFLRQSIGSSATFALPSFARSAARDYHVALSPEALEADPDLLGLLRGSGVGTVWVTGFLYGYWPYPLDRIQRWRREIERHGMEAHVANVPLGHPGDALGSMRGDVPLTPPKHWSLGVRVDGTTHSGVSLHSPATEENARALKLLSRAGVRRVFLDDDFRLAQGPGDIGGCFCKHHAAEFLRESGHPESAMRQLAGDIRARNLSPLLRQWIEFWCDRLTASFRAQQAAAPSIELGIMVMYLGAEKAGIRLADYRKVPFRVGELMFDDRAFGRLRGKTDELFSSLFHRRFVEPRLAYSETTAFPADKLSAGNMAAKLVVSTLSDVRHTMFMSGLTAFPRSYWDTLAPAMRKLAALHQRIAGHAPRGPFKHYWGEASRLVGDDRPYSLFLAAGVPFEVTDEPARDGWTFLSDADASAVAAGSLKSAGTQFAARTTTVLSGATRRVPETLADLFALKRSLLPQWNDTPVIEDEKPAVCAWYPTAGIALVWNLSERPETFSVRFGRNRYELTVHGLDVAQVPGLPQG